MRKLKETDSDKKVSELSQRHLHLCVQSINGQKYGDLVKAVLDIYIGKLGQKGQLQTSCKLAKDRVQLNNLKTNDVIKKLHGRCLEYDRENPGQKVTEFLFPDGNKGPIIHLSVYKKVAVLNDIRLKLQSLGETNGLAALSNEIKTSAELISAAIDVENQALTALNEFGVELLVVKKQLVKQHNDNYYNAAIDYGKAFAEMLYPVIKTKSKKENDLEAGLVDDETNTPTNINT